MFFFNPTNNNLKSNKYRYNVYIISSGFSLGQEYKNVPVLSCRLNCRKPGSDRLCLFKFLYLVLNCLVQFRQKSNGEITGTILFSQPFDRVR